MQHSLTEIRGLLGAVPRLRPVGAPYDHPNGCVIVCRDAAHVRAIAGEAKSRCKVAPIFATTGLKDGTGRVLREEIGARVIPTSKVGEHLSREVIVLVDPTLPRRETLKMATAVQAAGVSYFWFSDRPIPPTRTFGKFLESHGDKIVEIVNNLADETSIRCFLSRVKCFLTGEPSFQIVSDYVQYRHPVVRAEPGDVVCEGGTGPNAYTTKMFASLVGETGRVVAFEPVSSNYDVAITKVADHPNITLVKKGLWSERSQMEVRIADVVSTFMGTPKHQDKPTEICDLVSIDEHFASSGLKVSMIKLDIEGAEEKALIGAERVIEEMRPKLQICLYHNINHFFDIPLKYIRKGYKVYIGHHTPFMNECLMYAIAA